VKEDDLEILISNIAMAEDEEEKQEAEFDLFMERLKS